MPEENSKDALECRNPEGLIQLGGMLVQRAIDDISAIIALRHNETLQTKHIKVLVVDDEPLMTELLCGLFREEGYEADAAEDGDVAVEKVQLKEFQLVILNIRMPRMDGLEALPLIKTYSPTTKVIMYSGNCSPENNAKAKRLGASASVLKPASNTEILETVRKVLQGQAT